MKTKGLLIGLIVLLLSLACKKTTKAISQETNHEESQIDDYKVINQIENISFYSVLFKRNKTDYKVVFKDSLGIQLESFEFVSKKELKELYSCDFLENKNQKLIFVTDKSDSLFKVWSLFNKKVLEFKKTPNCFDYEPEESFE